MCDSRQGDKVGPRLLEENAGGAPFCAWAFRLVAALFAAVSLIAAETTFVPSRAAAQTDFPSRPIRLVLPWPAGGATDVYCRIIAEKLGPELNTTVVVENRAGASGFTGTSYVAKAKPDGYTLLFYTASTHTLGPQLFTNLPYDPVKDFVAISQVSAAPMILVTQNSSPFKTVKELVDAAKSEPGELNYAHYGRGSAAHLAGELFQLVTGAKLTPIVYKGSGPIIVDLLGDTVKIHAFFDPVAGTIRHINGGRMRALGLSSKEPSSLVPGIPTIDAVYPGFEFGVWSGIGAPAGTPRPIVDKIHAALVRVTKSQDLQKRFNELGIEPRSTSPEEFDTFVKNENERWRGLLQKMGIERRDL